MSEPNDAQAVIAGVLREHTHSSYCDYCHCGQQFTGNGVQDWANHLAEKVDAALDGLRRQRLLRGLLREVFPDEPTPQSRWVSGWTPEEAQL